MDALCSVPNPMSHGDISTPRPAKVEDSPLYLGDVKIAASEQVTTYKKTNVPNLWKHKNGTYYARLILGGERSYRSLHTNLKSVAVVELKKQEELAAKQRGMSPCAGGRPKTFRDCMELYRTQLNDDVTHSKATIKYRIDGLKHLAKHWHAMDSKPIDITVDDVLMWLKALSVAPRFIPPGAKHSAYHAKGVPGELSASKHNCAVDSIRGVLDVAVELGLAISNAARGAKIKRRQQQPKKLKLPTVDEFKKMLAHLEQSPIADHREALFLIEFCAFTGARIHEARLAQWSDVEAQSIWLTTKGHIDRPKRKVPLIPQARELLDKIRIVRKHVQDDEPILKLGECQKTLDAVCKEVGAPRITHHDLRHLFATQGIEKGVDIPTVSRWLGHKDGGALAMKVYGNIRDEHSQEMAKKVTF